MGDKKQFLECLRVSELALETPQPSAKLSPIKSPKK